MVAGTCDRVQVALKHLTAVGQRATGTGSSGAAARMDYTAPLDEEALVVEVAAGTYCFMNKIKPASVKLLWDKLSKLTLEALKQQKGVLLPNLGTFRVGPVVGETKKKIRPSFALLDTRYAGVSQERAKYNVGAFCCGWSPASFDWDVRMGGRKLP